MAMRAGGCKVPGSCKIDHRRIKGRGKLRAVFQLFGNCLHEIQHETVSLQYGDSDLANVGIQNNKIIIKLKYK